MLIELSVNGEVLSVVFHTDIHFETSHRLEEELSSFQLLDNIKNVEIDFSKVRFIDSTGISLLLTWIHSMSTRANVELIHVSEPVHNIFKICRLDQFAHIRN